MANWLPDSLGPLNKNETGSLKQMFMSLLRHLFITVVCYLCSLTFCLLSGGWFFNKTSSLARNSCELIILIYALVARRKQEAHFGWEFSFFIDSFCWPMDETEPSLRRKSMADSVQFLLNIYNSPLGFWNTINWQLQLYCHLKLIIKFAFQVGISLEISL